MRFPISRLAWLLSRTAALAGSLGCHQAWGDWTQLGGPYGTGITNETLPQRIDFKEPYWEKQLPSGLSSFVTDNSVVATLSQNQGREILLAFNMENGQQIWSRDLGPVSELAGSPDSPGYHSPPGSKSTPSLFDNRIVTLSSSFSLNAFRSRTGDPIWNTDLINEFGGKLPVKGVVASPLIDEQSVYVVGGGPGQSFLCFDIESGELVWKVGQGQPVDATPVKATIFNQEQILFPHQHGITSVSTADGEILWEHPFPQPVATASSPVVEEESGIVFFSSNLSSEAFRISRNPSKGTTSQTTTLWSQTNKPDSKPPWGTPVLHRQYLFGFFNDAATKSQFLGCLKITSGEWKWKEPSYSEGQLIRSADQLIILERDGKIAIVQASPKSYKELFRKKILSDSCWSTPSYSGGRVYARSLSKAICIPPRL